MAGIGGVTARPIQAAPEPAAQFRRQYAGATADELWLITKRAAAKALASDDTKEAKEKGGEAVLTFDEPSKVARATVDYAGMTVALKLAVCDDSLSITVEKCPFMVAPLLNRAIRRLLDRVPKRLEELRAPARPL